MKNFLFKQKIMLRLFSLLIGFFIWVYVVSSAQVEMNLKVALTIGLPEGLAIKNEINRELVYHLKGPRLLVRKFLEKERKIHISKKAYFKKRKYKYLINLDQFKLKLPPGLELTSLGARELVIELEALSEKFIVIKPSFSENILDNYKIEQLKIFPKKMKVMGPRSIVKSIKFLETQLIDELKLNKDNNFFVDVLSPDSRVRTHGKSINISYTLKSKKVDFVYSEIPIIFQSSSLIKSAFPKVVRVKVNGEESLINDLDKGTIQVIAYVPKGKHGKVEIELITELPQGIKLLEIIPKKVNLDLEK